MRTSDGKIVINEPFFLLQDYGIREVVVKKIGNKYYTYNYVDRDYTDLEMVKNDVVMINNAIFCNDNKVKVDILDIEYYNIEQKYDEVIASYKVTLFLLEEYYICNKIRDLLAEVKCNADFYNGLHKMQLCNYIDEIKKINTLIDDYIKKYQGTGNDIEVSKMKIDIKKFCDYLFSKTQKTLIEYKQKLDEELKYYGKY